MPWYREGKVAITAGQTTVTGTGTNFAVNSRVGDAFQGPDGRRYEVTNIASATVLSILPAYQGPTVAAGAYVIEPVHGYPKALTDSFREVNAQWGTTLAGLGAVSTEDVVPVAKGGTGGTNQAQARSGLGLKAAAVADIVGSVSQSGGNPTGAIVERGSNANGEYTKFADGTMIVFMRVAWAGGVGVQTAPYPANFVSVPVGVGQVAGVVSGSAGGSFVTEFAGSAGTATFKVLTHTPTSIIEVVPGAVINMHIIGRWY